MKKIGILGGMSWPSTVDYYKTINFCTNFQLGGLHSAEIIIHSADFAEIERLQKAGCWEELGRLLGENAKRFLKEADILIIATNTMHKVADQVEQISGKKVLHIADATAKAIRQNNIDKVGLLGTGFTMEESFYKDRLTNFGIEVVVPNKEERQEINYMIYDELVRGQIRTESKERLENIIRRLVTEHKCQGIILGCTELPLLFEDDRDPCCGVPLFNTTYIHAAAAALEALS